MPTGPKERKVQFGVYKGLYFDIDLSCQTQLYLGLWERETYPYIVQAARKSKWAIDVGAGKGELSAYLLKRSEALPVIAIEPSIDECERLRYNLKLNGVVDHDGFFLEQRMAGKITDSRSLRLDDLDLDVESTGFIKIDVDGAEIEVLQGAAGILAARSVSILLETHSSQLERASLSLLSEYGFASTIIPNASWRWIIPEHRPISHNRWLFATAEG